jgi:antitoxin YefM
VRRMGIPNQYPSTQKPNRGHEDLAIIPASEFNSLMETAHLLQSPANAKRLFAAIARALAGAGYW